MWGWLQDFLRDYVHDSGDGVVVVGGTLAVLLALGWAIDRGLGELRPRYEHCEHCAAAERVEEGVTAAGAVLSSIDDSLRDVVARQNDLLEAVMVLDGRELEQRRAGA